MVTDIFMPWYYEQLYIRPGMPESKCGIDGGFGQSMYFVPLPKRYNGPINTYEENSQTIQALEDVAGIQERMKRLQRLKETVFRTYTDGMHKGIDKPNETYQDQIDTRAFFSLGEGEFVAPFFQGLFHL